MALYFASAMAWGNPPEKNPAAEKEAAGGAGGAQRFVREGIAVEFTLDPVMGEKGKPVGATHASPLLEGEDAVVRFRITDTTTGTAMMGLHPAAWIDLRPEGQAADPKRCQQKVQSFLQASLSARPEIDLNAYYVLALNREPNISVIDPLLGFGSSKLYTLVLLKSPGEDWVLSRDRKRLFVTLPAINQVAVVDTATWKVGLYLDVGPRPARLALQPDGKYLWVGIDGIGATDAESGVTVIDADALKVAAHLRTGPGHHEIAFTDDDRYAFVTNRDAGTLSVIDIRKLIKIQEIPTGRLPAALAFSQLSQALYVVHEGDGSLVVLDGQSQKVLTRLQIKPGLRAIRFTPDGRWGLVVNSKENRVHILDSATHRILQTVEVGKGPDQIAITRTFAYIRSAGTEEVSLIPLGDLGKGGAPSVTRFPAGQALPENRQGQAELGAPADEKVLQKDPGIFTENRQGQSEPAAPEKEKGHQRDLGILALKTGVALADAIVPTPEGNSVLVANPADQIIYYYMEGMAAPMGNFQNYRREPRAVLVLDRSLRETAPGVYSTQVQLTKSGTYDVAFLLDSPRILHCFDLAVKSNPGIQKKKGLPIQVEFLSRERKVRVGEMTRLQFKLTDPESRQPKNGLKDVGVLTFLVPGVWQKTHWAQPAGEGTYEVAFTLPQPGVYHLFFQCPSLGVRYNQLPYLTLQAVGENPPVRLPRPQ